MRINWQNVRIPIALGLVMLLQIGMFVHVHAARWEEAIAPLKQPAEREGEGLVIRGNGLGYYAWLRSLLIDGDLDFANEFDEHGVAGDWMPPPTYVTPLGKRANQWSVGPACFWGIFVVPGHYIIKAIDPAMANGYSLPYQLLVGAAGLSGALIGLVCLYGICRHFARPSRAALATAFITLGSTLTYYWSVEVSMAHGLGASALAAYVWYWLKTYGSSSVKRWALVGFLLGIACLMRWQLATFAVLPLGEAFLTWWRSRGRGTLPVRCSAETHGLEGRATFAGCLTLLGIACLAALVAFSPQMIAWKHIYGHWLVEPVQGIIHHWLSPALWQVLVSQDRSLFYWTPICAVAFFGSPMSVGSPKAEQGLVLMLSFVLQVYALASVWGQGEFLQQLGNHCGAFLSKAYGMRHLTEVLIVLAPGLASLLNHTSQPIRVFGLTLACLLTTVNLLLIHQYGYGLLPSDEGVPVMDLVGKTIAFIRNDPWLALVLAEAVGLIFLILSWRREAKIEAA